MPQINKELLKKIQDKLQVSENHAYRLIAEKARTTYLQRHLAAVALAADLGINVHKKGLASDSDRQAIAAAAAGRSAATTNAQPSAGKVATPGKKAAPKKPTPKRKSNSVMVVHGRNIPIRDAIFALLRALGLNPIEWTSGVKATRKGAPVIREVLDAMFSKAAAVVVLLTPDDLAKLHSKLLKSTDWAHEKKLTGQARPNVLFEAGRAFGSHPDSTIMVQVGPHRPFSDTAGVHVVHLGNDAASRTDLANRLESAGCAVDRTGTDWITTGNFKLPAHFSK
jgi:predicted nucleotide-binding protein